MSKARLAYGVLLPPGQGGPNTAATTMAAVEDMREHPEAALETYDFSGGHLSADDVTTLAIILGANTTVLAVNLNDTNVSEAGAQQLLAALQKNRTLQGMWLKDNPNITAATLAAIRARLFANVDAMPKRQQRSNW